LKRGQFRQTKVQDLGFAPARDKDVRRLDVAMGDALQMRCLQPTGNLNGDVQQFIDW